MSEALPKDAPTEATFNAAEELKNAKAEFQRKYGNLEESTKSLQTQIQQLVSQLKGAPAASSAPEKKVSVFEDEEAYGRRIKAEAADEIRRELATQGEQAKRYQAMSMQLVSEYPELNDKSSALMKKAQSIYDGLPESEKAHPFAMKSAVYDAASDLDLKPFNKRAPKDDADGFSLGSGSGAATGDKKRKGDLTAEQESLAALLGIDVSNKETRARLNSNHNRRKGYGKYE